MPAPRRNKPRDAASKARPASPRSARLRRRGRAPGAGGPEAEGPPRAEADQPGQRRPVSGGSARPGSPRRPRKPRAPNAVPAEALGPGALLRRLQGLSFLLEQLRDRLHLLRRRPLSLRATVGLGERRPATGPRSRPQAPLRRPLL